MVVREGEVGVMYTPFGDLYNNAPKFVIHGSLRNCTTVLELADLAASKGFDVSFEPSGFANDIRLNEGFDASAPLRNYSFNAAKRFIERHPGCA